MKVYLLKNVESVGQAGEMIKVADGYASNFLLPRKLAVEITAANETLYVGKQKAVEQKKTVQTAQTSQLADKIGETTVVIKRKLHDDGKLYGALSAHEIADALSAKGIAVSKSQVDLTKSIKAQGTYEVTIKLSSRLQPKVTVRVVSE